MSQILWKNSFGKGVSPFLAGNLMSWNFKQFFGSHFETVRPIFALFGFFWCPLSLASISTRKSFGKVRFWGWARADSPPPLTTNGSAEDPFHRLHLGAKSHHGSLRVITLLWQVIPIPLSPQKHETASQSGPAGPLAARTELNRWTAIREGPIYMGPAGP